jgi:hypothetical protein
MKDIVISKSDSKSLLTAIKIAIDDCDYVTANMFEAFLDVAVSSYLRGKGLRLDGLHQQKNRDYASLQVADALWEFASDESSYSWFVEWIARLDSSLAEKELLP